MSRDEVRLGRLHLDINARQLARDGVPIALSSRAFDILCVFAAAQGEVVTKDELMSRVWPGLVVDENTIRVHVSALRKALGEGESGEAYVLTVPGRGYRLIGVNGLRSGAEGDQDSSLRMEPTEKPFIAVLPFQNMSGDPEQEYFVDGMVDEIITGLSRIKWLSVISRNSTFIYKSKPVAIKEVVDKLGVRYVLEGGVRKSGNRIRITAQLIDGKTDTHLWAEQYERILEDVFALQDEITMCVIGAIEPSLWRAEIDRIKRRRPTNLNAYDLLLRSVPYVLGHVPKESEPAIPLLEEALKLQPDYAAAHAFLGRCLHHRYARAGLREEDRLAATRHSRAAVVYGSDDATVLATAAHIIALTEHDTTTALKLFDRALELSNSNVFALSFSAVTLGWMGRTELAVERAERALRLSPFDFYNFRVHHALALVHFYSGNYADAVDAAQRAVHANPSFSTGHAVLGAALLRGGHAMEAKAAAQAVLEHEPAFSIRGVRQVAGQLEPAVFGPLAEAWREIGLPE